ncbi:hypothetical protein [Kitasatospora kifunensis]|uniref:Uncharacterized protein n=1 Tax=Kitasatospora kifunensis TaxID=58351 RepID=A0A7W7W0A1_KITKI|nr:hypothetical protein [Kitasatospora kifunensis]MBB4928455.1 hypothetical protein [Kitasatospora kifunensis]
MSTGLASFTAFGAGLGIGIGQGAEVVVSWRGGQAGAGGQWMAAWRSPRC